MAELRTEHRDRRVADLLVHGVHADYLLGAGPHAALTCLDAEQLVLNEGVCVPQPGSGWVQSVEVERLHEPPTRLGIWGRTYVQANDFRQRHGLATNEVRIITTPAGVRGLHHPVFVRVGDWFADRHAGEITTSLAETAKGLDITDQPDLLKLVVAWIISLRNAGERKEHGAQ